LKKLKLKKNILVSSGYKNIHINNQAYELQKTNKLFSIISGYIPKSKYLKILKISIFSKLTKLQRIKERKNNIKDTNIINFILGEILFNIALILRQKNLVTLSFFDKLTIFCLNIYSNFAKKIIKNHHKHIKFYHFRSGYGGNSVKYAKTKNIYTICDHTIAHPDVIKYMIKNKGKFPNKRIVYKKDWWQLVKDDLLIADCILVNSNFVKKTLVHMGIKKKIDVIYTGASKFFETQYKFIKNINKKKIILYAGGITKRKGLNDLQKAFKKIDIDNFQFRIAGQISNYSRKEFSYLLSKNNVKYLGNLNSAQLKNEYKKADIFLFPSLVEGSAKVIFEAMAAGCAIITTPNSGSIVKNKINGIIIQPGEPNEIIKSIKILINNESLLNKISKNNIKTISNYYRQSSYGVSLNKFYDKLNEQSF